MVSEQRQRVIETNRSLRTIKNELESLLEKGLITESAFDSIQSLLPTESSLSAAPTPAARTPGLPTPSSPVPPTTNLSNLSINPPPGPPSYQQSTGSGPPPLPGRNQPPPPAPPTKPIIAHARALYKYSASDARDCSFERDDRIEIHEYMNADWWMGRNSRTGAEGIFPKNYVEVEQQQPPSHNEKAGWHQPPVSPYPGQYGHGAAGTGYVPPAQPVYGGHAPPPPGPVNPYNAQAPPMAVAEQGGGSGGKAGGMGKKVAGKLGNAAIFGAGATIGSNIVNSIF